MMNRERCCKCNVAVSGGSICQCQISLLQQEKEAWGGVYITNEEGVMYLRTNPKMGPMRRYIQISPAWRNNRHGDIERAGSNSSWITDMDMEEVLDNMFLKQGKG